jgi:hypothetical protein
MWLDLIWTLGLYLVIFAIIWWAVSEVEKRVPKVQPFIWLIWVVLIVAAAAIAVGILIGKVPLIPFLEIGSRRLG